MVVTQDTQHDPRRDCEKVPTIRPSFALLEEAHERLVHEGGWVERDAPDRLSSPSGQDSFRKANEVLLDETRDVLHRFPVPFVRALE